MPKMKKVVILGAGPTGLVSALELLRNGNCEIEIIEKEPFIGGISATFQHGEFHLDIGTHRFYSGMSDDVFKWIKEILGDELLDRPRNCRIYFMDKFVKYPPDIRELLRKIGVLRPFVFLIGYLWAKTSRHNLNTYEGYLINRFGKYFYELFYQPYAEKVWGIPLDILSSEQALRRVNVLNFRDIIMRLIKKDIIPNNYFYSKNGIGEIWERIGDELKKSGVVIRTSSIATRFFKQGNAIKIIEYSQEGRDNTVHCDYLISTIPIPEVINGMHPKPMASAIEAVSHLRYRALIVLYIILKSPFVSSHETYYFPSKEIPFNRVYEPKNYSPYVVPKYETCLGIEITCHKSDSIWEMRDEALFDLVFPYLERLDLLNAKDVKEYFSKRIENAYPIYEIGYRKYLKDVLEEVGSIDNMIMNGRQGLFIHQNMHHSIRMGIAAAQHVSGCRDVRQWYCDTIKGFDTFKVFD
jgi:protoporphyrinogen oxidase